MTLPERAADPKAFFWNESFGRFPAVFHQPLAKALVFESELLHCVRACFYPGADGKVDSGSRIWKSGQLIGKDWHLYLPDAQHRSVEAYIAAMHSQGRRDLCISAWKPHYAADHLFDRIVEFTKPITDQYGLPAGGIGSDIFLGDYSLTPGGVHIDGTDVFSFVVSGRKKMLLWPFEVFARHTKISQGGNYDILSGIDYRDYLEEAIVLTGEVGDIMYWPHSYWHMALGDGSPVATFNLSFYLNKSKNRFIIETAREMEAIHERVDYHSAESLEALRSDSTSIHAFLEKVQIKQDKFLSQHGLMGQPPKRQESPALEQGLWRTSKVWPIVYRENTRHSTLTVRGRTIIVPLNRALPHFVDFISQAPGFSFEDIIHPKAIWNEEGAPRIEHRKMLSALYSFGSLEIVQ